jgi:MFS family permease
MQNQPVARARPPLWPIYLCVAVTAMGIGIVNPILPKLLAEKGASEFIVGLTTSVMFASLALTAWPIGKKIDRIGIRPFLFLGLASYSISMLLMPWASKISYFFLLRCFEGIGWSAVWTAAETYVSQVSLPERRGHNTAVYGMSLSAGTASGPLVGSALFSIWEPLPFLVAVGLSIGAGVIVLLIVPEPHVHREEHAVSGGISFSLLRPLVLPLLIAFLYGYGTMSLVALLPLLPFSTFEIGTLITVTVVANIIAQIPIGRLLDRFGYRPLLLSSLTLLSGAALFATFHLPFVLLLVLGSMLGAFAGTLYPIGLAVLATRVPPAKLGGANGLYTVSYGLGSVFGPAITGGVMTIVGSGHSDQALFGTIGALVFTMLIAILLGIDKVHGAEEQPLPSSSGSFKPPL